MKIRSKPKTFFPVAIDANAKTMNAQCEPQCTENHYIIYQKCVSDSFVENNTKRNYK